ncbi:hypothetical protein L484_027138 [Morus notabilis]|uniref:Late embryogenesis abundant protein LEA-2 subgroup domain-containing protein n=1 Tax=Morus notabilis TaxID=981085 RepID=W9S108_9ROSA|nr:NDR1/HIN1-like protein 6 [Morus notabilis]EXC20583.1 hypothetical protein L484_027138 [Morus notabilis]
MADNQRIHPSQDPEAPLVPKGASNSEKGDQASASASAPPYPPFQRTIPLTQSNPPKKRRSCLCKCLCWTFLVILILIIVIAATVGILYLVFRPKLPKYSIDDLQVTQFNLSSNDSLSATFDVTITARNPNKKIGIYYEGGSRIRVYYNGTRLCQGALPKFYQGHRNTTRLVVPVTGQTANATGLINDLQAERQQTGYVPLALRVKQPVRIKLGRLKLFKIKFYVKCSLNVDSLEANNDIKIRNSSCKFRLWL